jgi:molybdopterin synthase sulfur carrier subunit
MNTSNTSNTRGIPDTPGTHPSIKVSFPDALRARVSNRPSVIASGGTVREIIDALEQDFPGIRFNLCHETGELRPYVNIFLNHQNIRYLQGLDTPVTSGVQMHILQSVAGG